MKWKSVSPDVKRRDSPKFRSYYNEKQSSGLNVDLVMMKFEEMERRERELQKELEYYRLNFKENGSGNSGFRNDYSSNNAASYNSYTDDHHNRSSYNSFNEYSYNDSSYNSYNGYNTSCYYPAYDRPSPYKSHTLHTHTAPSYNNPLIHTHHNMSHNQEDDEDELYFHGGGRKRKNVTEDEIYKIEESQQQPIEQDDYEYDPVDFESEASSIMSYSDEDDFEEEDYKKMTKSKKKSNIILKARDSVSVPLTVRPKAYSPKIIDFDAPSYTKIPPNPVPNTWAHIVHNPLKQGVGECKEILTSSICDDPSWYSELKLDKPVQGILMRPPFSEHFSVKQWAEFMKGFLPNVLVDGYLFIWVEREELADVLRAAERHLSFKYVENLCWIRRDLGNRLFRESGNLFYKSKMTLLILRRDPNNRCKLRHQRNPDCIFDFIGSGSGRMPDGRVYDVIETLLDGSKSSGPHLMHLWASNSATDRLVYQARKKWIRVLETEQEDYPEDPALSESNASSSYLSVLPSLPPTCKIPSSTFDEDFCNFIICDEAGNINE